MYARRWRRRRRLKQRSKENKAPTLYAVLLTNDDFPLLPSFNFNLVKDSPPPPPTSFYYLETTKYSLFYYIYYILKNIDFIYNIENATSPFVSYFYLKNFFNLLFFFSFESVVDVGEFILSRFPEVCLF